MFFVDFDTNGCVETDLCLRPCFVKEVIPTEIHGSTGISYNSNFKQGNFKASQTVFKPYKRCSVEAKEEKTREEAGKKKICLPEEA